MNYLYIAILGLLQGLTEFLPVSSSGHLVLAQHFLGFDPPGITLEVCLHFGTLLAVLVYFRQDVLALLTALKPQKTTSENTKAHRRLLGYLLISTIVTGAIGFPLKDVFETAFESPMFVAGMLLVTGCILMLSLIPRGRDLTVFNLGLKRAAILGLGQAVAILPGISRSGTTIITALLTGLTRADAARYSFLIAIPAILGATLADLKDIASVDTGALAEYAVGALVAMISGYLVIHFLIGMIKKNKLYVFAIYCWLVGGISLLVMNL